MGVSLFGTGFLINRKYKQTIMNFEAAEDRICSLRMKGKSNFTIILVHKPKEEKHELEGLIYDKLNQI
jgi:hypothetical protein